MPSHVTLPFSAKLTAIFLALAIGPMVLIGWLAYGHLLKTSRQHLGLLFQGIAEQATKELDRDMTEIYGMLGGWTSLDLMQEVITDDADAKISAFLIQHQRQHKQFINLRLINRHRVVVAASHPDWIRRQVPEAGCASALGGRIYLEDVHRDEEHDTWLMTFGFPIEARFEPGLIIGTLCADWQAGQLTNLLRTTTTYYPTDILRSTYLLVMRRDGLLLASTIPQGLPELYKTRLQLGVQGHAGYLVEKWLTGTDALIGYAVSRGYQEFPGFSWTILAVQDVKTAFAPLAQLRRVVLWVGLLVLVVVTLLALVFARQATKPIRALVAYTTRIASGDFQSEPPVTSTDELGVLAHALSRMAGELSRLVQTEKELAASAATTEAEQHRAAELEELNKRLQGLLAVKDEFIAKASHELRTPLTSITEGLSLLQENALGETTAEQQDFLKTMRADVDRLTELVNNVLDLSKIEAGKIRLQHRRIDIHDVLNSIVASYRTLIGHRALSIESGSVPPVFADPDRMRQVFVNLLSNAIKFTPDDGTIIFRLEHRADEVAVVVQDTGRGIAPEDIPQLFQKFSQVGPRDPNQPRGTGLGLVVCKELVELHNGRIDVTSEVGRGTTFTVLLPRYTEVLALSTGFNELGILAKQQGKPLGLLALRADASLKPSGEADERRQQLERLAEEIRRSVHRDDVVLEMEPHWVVLLVIADTDGVRAIVRRLRGSLGMSDAVQVGAALYPDDGTDPMALFERATKTLNQGLASVS